MAEPPPSAPSARVRGSLRRRKVGQWGLAYVAVAWGLVQGIEFAVATFGWPLQLTRVAAVLAVFGLGATVIVAWFHGDLGAQRISRLELALLGGVAACAAVTATYVARMGGEDAVRSAQADVRGQPSRPRDRHRIAVLPFANLGGDPANAAFVGGVHDTLITQIAKLPGLSVISRSSVMQFQANRATIAEIAQALNVGVVLEGSVQRDGDRLRIQAQLIDAANDAHLWAETFDRRSDDLFDVQSEIALAIASQLRIHLTTAESRQVGTILTKSPEAYEHYVVGRNHLSQERTTDGIRELTTAVTVDPGFAAAYAQLSLAHTWYAFEKPVERNVHLSLAREAADKALALDPTLPEAHVALGVYFYRGEPDLERAGTELQAAIEGIPNDADVHRFLGFLRRWQGRWEEAYALFRRAAALDPLGSGARSAIKTLAMLGRREEALQLAREARRSQPATAFFAVLPAQFALDFECDLAGSRTALEALPDSLRSSTDALHLEWFLDLAQGDPAAALAVLDRGDALRVTDDTRDWRRGLALTLANRASEGRVYIERSAAATAAQIDQVPTDWDRAWQLSWLALHRAMTGQHEVAIELAQRALATLPPTGAEMARAETYLSAIVALTQAGDLSAATGQARTLLDIPGEVKPPGLWCDPLLRPLRDVRQYRELMAARGVDLRLDPHDPATWPRRRLP